MGQEADEPLGRITHFLEEAARVGVGAALFLLADGGDLVPIQFVGVKDLGKARDQVTPFVGQDPSDRLLFLVVILEKLHSQVNHVILASTGNETLGGDNPSRLAGGLDEFAFQAAHQTLESKEGHEESALTNVSERWRWVTESFNSGGGAMASRPADGPSPLESER